MLSVYSKEKWRHSWLASKGSVTTRWLGGRRPFEVDSFHAAPIDIMLQILNIGGTRPPRPPGGGALTGIPNVAAFLDDIAVTGYVEKHRQNVQEVLRRISSAGLLVNADKSVWLADEVNYLGFRSSSAGVQTTSERTRAVREAPEPCNLSDLRAYLGMLHY